MSRWGCFACAIAITGFDLIVGHDPANCMAILYGFGLGLLTHWIANL